MNRVNNWTVIALILTLVAILVMMFTPVPAASWAVAAFAVAAWAMVLIRYEDHIKALSASAV